MISHAGEKEDRMDKKRLDIMKSMVSNNGKLLYIGTKKVPDFSEDTTVITVDINPKFKPNIVADLNNFFPFKSNSFDTIFAGEVLEHMVNDISFLKECRRVLKKYGELVLSVPNICSLKNRIKVLFGRLPTYSAGDVDFHVHDYSLNKLNKLFKSLGYKIVCFKSNGIYYHAKQILPSCLVPPSLSENLILKAIKR